MQKDLTNPDEPYPSPKQSFFEKCYPNLDGPRIAHGYLRSSVWQLKKKAQECKSQFLLFYPIVLLKNSGM